MSHILDTDATAQLEALAARRISAVELLDLAEARRAASQSQLNAVVAMDVSGARARAQQIDEDRVRQRPQGRLAGLPMTVKDTFDVTDLPASAGLAAFRDRDCVDAAAVARVRAAGAVIWGKTNVPVLAMDIQSYNDLYGVTNNPWDLQRTPGGSSGGAACAVATGVSALEIGSDIGGSLRVPAHFCGVYSHKPSWGAVSQRGHVPPRPGTHAARDLNVIGPLARSARDLQLLFGVICDLPFRPAPIPELKSLRVALWLDEPSFPLDPEVRRTLQAYADDLSAAGVTVEPIASPVDTAALMDAYRVLLFAAIFPDLPDAERAVIEGVRDEALRAIAAGEPIDAEVALAVAYAATHAEWLAADEVRAQLTDQIASRFTQFDVILAPVTPTAAFPHDHSPFGARSLCLSDGRMVSYLANLTWIGLATACRLPATCAPAGLTASGLPVGAQLIGPPGGDARTLAVAEALARVRGFCPPTGPNAFGAP